MAMSEALASRYANALADAVLDCREEISPGEVTEQLQALETLIAASDELRNVLLSPAVKLEKKKALLARLGERLGMHRLVRNFVLIVVRNRRSDLFGKLRNAFETALDERMGIVRAEIYSAFELDAPSRSSLEAQLERMIGKQLRCRYAIEPSLLGGAVVRLGSTIYDGSLRGRLEQLRRRLAAEA